MATVSRHDQRERSAIAAAQDPNSPVTAQDAQRTIVEESRSAGVTAFTFDPDATTEEKKAQARAAIPDGLRSSRPKGVAIATDMDKDGKPDYDLPSPSKAGVIEVHKDASGQDEEIVGAKMGEQTGWAPTFGWPTESVLEGTSLLDHQTWLEGKLSDKFYGDWYYNAAVIVFASLSSWLVAVLGGGLGWVLLVMAICGTYYRTSLRRVRRNFRDDINRELSLKRIETDTESLEWINSFMVKFWPIYQPVLAQTVINAVDQVLSGATPAFLDSLKLRTFTLGSKPPRMEHVKTYPKAEDDVVIMDWKFSFTPNDTADMTTAQIKNKLNPKVILEIRIGKAMISKGLDIIVEDMSFSGIMRLKIKLQIPFPHVEKVEMCFLERPTLDYVCKPLGGETFGFDINFIPGLESFINEQIHGNLAPMMYAPNVFPIEVAKMLSGSAVDQAIGVVAVTLHGAQGLKNPDNFAGNPDGYAVLTLNKRQALAQTKVVKDNPNPRWNETHYIIITSFNDSLDIQLFDYNEFRKDKELGVASFALDQLEDITTHENERIEVSAVGKARGVLSCDIQFFPVLAATKAESGSEIPPPDSNTGILRFTVEQAKDLDGTRSLVGLLNPYAGLILNGKEVHTTKKLKRTNNPIWDNGSKEILITDRRAAKLGVAIKDDRDIGGDQVIGTYQIKLDDMLDLMAKGQDWYNLAQTKTGRVKMQAQWKPVALGAIAGSGGYVVPIGVMRFHFKSAKDLRNFETMGKSDPYARVLLSGVEHGRTVTHRNTLDPIWDEVVYVPIHSPREKLSIEVMDAEKMGKDRSLGLIDVFSGDYISQDETGEYLVNETKTSREDGLRMHGKGIVKGLLNYTVAFYPSMNIADPEDEAADKAEAEKKQQSLDIPRSPEAGTFSSALSSPIEPKSPLTVPPSPTVSRKSKDGPRPSKVYMSPQELLKQDCGLVIFRLMEADLPKSNTHIEVVVDDMAYPSYVSSTAKSRVSQFDEIGDCFIRELEFSKLTIKVRERGGKSSEDNEDRTIARLSGNTLDTLKQCLNNPTVLKMKDEHGNISTVKVSLKYIPIKMHLDPSESMNNMGNLRVDVLDAENLPSADSNGKSDPYCKFELNGNEVFKTKVQKKTLEPVWNEFFEVPVSSRTGAKFNVRVMDWDFADKPDFLGGAVINLEQLEPFQAQEVRLILDGKSGVLRLRLLFRPDYVTRSRLGTSTFSGTFGTPGRVLTGVAGAPIKGGTAVAGVLGHGVGKGASFLKRGIGGSKRDDGSNGGSSSPAAYTSSNTLTSGGASDLGPSPLSRSAALGNGYEREGSPDVSAPGPAVGASNGVHNRTKSFGAQSMHSAHVSGAETGSATISIVSATGYSPSTDLYFVVEQIMPKKKTVGKTKHHKASGTTFSYNELFRWTCTPDSTFQIIAKEKRTFKDEDLGEAMYVVDESGSNGEKEVKVGNGTVTIKSNFVSANESNSSNTTPGGGGNGAHMDSPKSALRRSFLAKRDIGRPSTSREGTPTPSTPQQQSSS